MKVYIVTSEPYHDNSSILGVYDSLDKAKSQNPATWIENGYYVVGMKHNPSDAAPYRGAFPNCVSESVEGPNDDLMLIYEWEVA